MVKVAEIEGLPETFVSSCIDTGGGINKVLNSAPQNTSDKPEQKKPKHDKIKISKGPITTFRDQPEPTTFDMKLAFQRENCS